jgi:hypothetical protein
MFEKIANMTTEKLNMDIEKRRIWCYFRNPLKTFQISSHKKVVIYGSPAQIIETLVFQMCLRKILFFIHLRVRTLKFVKKVIKILLIILVPLLYILCRKFNYLYESTRDNVNTVFFVLSILDTTWRTSFYKVLFGSEMTYLGTPAAPAKSS